MADLPDAIGLLRISAAGFLPSTRTCGARGRVAIVLANPGASLRGIVRSARTGRPVAGARVRVAEPHAAVLASTGTDEHGRFALNELPAGVHGIVVGHGEYASRRRWVRLDGEVWTEIELEDATALELLVVDRSTGLPLPGAVLSDGSFEVRTNPEGRARIPIAARRGGRTLVLVSRAEYVTLSRAFVDVATDPAPIELDPGGEFAVLVGLEDGVRGDGLPSVVLTQQPAPGVSTLRRAILEPLVDGTGWLARATGFSAQGAVEASAHLRGCVPAQGRALPFEETVGSLHRIVLSRSAPGHGTVLDTAGRVVAGARLLPLAPEGDDAPINVSAFHQAWERTIPRALTDDHGRFTLPLDPRGTRDVLVHSRGHPLTLRTLEPGSEAELVLDDFPGAPGDVAGVVRSSLLPRIDVVRVLATNEIGDSWTTFADPGGAFAFHDLPPGMYRLVATGEDATDHIACYSRGPVSPGAEHVLVEAR